MQFLNPFFFVLKNYKEIKLQPCRQLPIGSRIWKALDPKKSTYSLHNNILMKPTNQTWVALAVATEYE